MSVKKGDVLKDATVVSKAAKDVTYWLREAGSRKKYSMEEQKLVPTTTDDKLACLRRAYSRACVVADDAAYVKRQVALLLTQEQAKAVEASRG